jgi:hypothetical protein
LNKQEGLLIEKSIQIILMIGPEFMGKREEGFIRPIMKMKQLG